jgi:hypothetical protein
LWVGNIRNNKKVTAVNRVSKVYTKYKCLTAVNSVSSKVYTIYKGLTAKTKFTEVHVIAKKSLKIPKG